MSKFSGRWLGSNAWRKVGHPLRNPDSTTYVASFESAKAKERFKPWRRWMKNDRLDQVFAEAHRNLPYHGPRRQSADRELNDFRTKASRIT